MEPTATAPIASSRAVWRIEPEGFFSRHFALFQGDKRVATLKMGFWREGCEFAIAGHLFTIERKSVWKDGFHLKSDGQTYCDVTKSVWSRQFTLAAGCQSWCLRPAGWFTRTYVVTENERVVGTILPTGWFTRKRTATFISDVPPPIQVLAIYLVLLVAQRERNKAAN